MRREYIGATVMTLVTALILGAGNAYAGNPFAKIGGAIIEVIKAPVEIVVSVGKNIDKAAKSDTCPVLKPIKVLDSAVAGIIPGAANGLERLAGAGVDVGKAVLTPCAEDVSDGQEYLTVNRDVGEDNQLADYLRNDTVGKIISRAGVYVTAGGIIDYQSGADIGAGLAIGAGATAAGTAVDEAGEKSE